MLFFAAALGVRYFHSHISNKNSNNNIRSTSYQVPKSHDAFRMGSDNERNNNQLSYITIQENEQDFASYPSSYQNHNNDESVIQSYTHTTSVLFV